MHCDAVKPIREMCMNAGAAFMQYFSVDSHRDGNPAAQLESMSENKNVGGKTTNSAW